MKGGDGRHAGLPALSYSLVLRARGKVHAPESLGGIYLRSDTIKRAIAEGNGAISINDEGYRVGEDNLRLGRRVIANAVNALQITRQAWRRAAGTVVAGT